MSETASLPLNPADDYEAHFVPAMFGPLAEVVLAEIPPWPGARVLDLACGTGVVARRAAAMVGQDGRVTGLDLNPRMLEVAEREAIAMGVQIDWLEGNALDLPFPDAAFDLVICQQGIQFFPDQLRAVQEMRRVTAPGGKVAVAVWRGLEVHPFFNELNEIAVHLLGGPAFASPFSLGDPAQLTGLFSSAGFAEISALERPVMVRFTEQERFVDRQMVASAVVLPELRHLDRSALHDLAQAFRAEAEPVLAAHRQGDELVVPMTALIVQGVD